MQASDLSAAVLAAPERGPVNEPEQRPKSDWPESELPRRATLNLSPVPEVLAHLPDDRAKSLPGAAGFERKLADGVSSTRRGALDASSVGSSSARSHHELLCRHDPWHSCWRYLVNMRRSYCTTYSHT